MQITRQADYAVRAMLFLAKLEPNQRAATSQIAEVQKIPPSFWQRSFHSFPSPG